VFLVESVLIIIVDIERVGGISIRLIHMIFYDLYSHVYFTLYPTICTFISNYYDIHTIYYVVFYRFITLNNYNIIFVHNIIFVYKIVMNLYILRTLALKLNFLSENVTYPHMEYV